MKREWNQPFVDELNVTSPAGNMLDLLVDSQIIFDPETSTIMMTSVTAAYGVKISRGDAYSCRDQEFGGSSDYTASTCDFKEKLNGICEEEDQDCEGFNNAQIYAATGNILQDTDLMAEVICYTYGLGESCSSPSVIATFVDLISQLQFFVQLFVPRGYENELLADGDVAAGICDNIHPYMPTVPGVVQIVYGDDWFSFLESLDIGLSVALYMKMSLTRVLASHFSNREFYCDQDLEEEPNDIDWFYSYMREDMINGYILYKYSFDLLDDEERSALFDFITIRETEFHTCGTILGMTAAMENKNVSEIKQMVDSTPLPSNITFDEFFDAFCGDFDTTTYDNFKSLFQEGFEAPVMSPTDAPVTNAPVTNAPVTSPTDAPIVPPTSAPAVPPTDAPIIPPTSAPIVPPTSAPIIPPTNAPIVPPTNAPIVPPTNAPIIPPTNAPIVPPTNAPIIPPTEDVSTFAPLATPTSFGKKGKKSSGKKQPKQKKHRKF